jgi:hypothetical protein
VQDPSVLALESVKAPDPEKTNVVPLGRWAEFQAEAAEA